VRTADVDDVPGIVATYLDSWRAGYRRLLSLSVLEAQAERRSRFDWGSLIRSERAHVAVATDRAGIVGVVAAADGTDNYIHLPEIQMLYVRPSAWGMGSARDLLAVGTDWLRERGAPTGHVRVVEQQARARRFYEREGWTLDPEMPLANNGLVDLVYDRRDL
jgi:GNAT superfamily N-acetyltransferase